MKNKITILPPARAIPGPATNTPRPSEYNEEWVFEYANNLKWSVTEKVPSIEDVVFERIEFHESWTAIPAHLRRQAALYLQGYSAAEIATLVGVSRSTVHRNINKLLKK